MESQKIYKTTYEELNKMKKSLNNSQTLTIDFTKLDGRTSETIRTAIVTAINSRMGDVSAAYLGNQK